MKYKVFRVRQGHNDLSGLNALFDDGWQYKSAHVVQGCQANTSYYYSYIEYVLYRKD